MACLLIGNQVQSLDIGFLTVETRDQNDIQYFESVFEDPDRRAILEGLLAKQDIFLTTDPRIVDKISGMCGVLPHSTDPGYIDAAQACAALPVPNRLRDLAQRELPPFHPSGLTVRIGVPDSSDQPPVGMANTCDNGPWFARHVVLMNRTDIQRQIEIHANRHYGSGVCIGTADFQLNEKDAFTILDRPINKLNDALAIPVSR